MGWFSNDNDKRPSKPESLLPGKCECGHSRCCHIDGKGACRVAICRDDDDKPLPQSEWAICACQIYIRDDDDDSGDGPDTPIDPEVAELERINKL